MEKVHVSSYDRLGTQRADSDYLEMDEVILVERTIIDSEEHPTESEVYTKVKSRVSQNKFVTIMGYLRDTNKIHYEPTGEITWQYHPHLLAVSTPYNG